MTDAADGERERPARQQQAAERVATALAVVGNWMFSTGARRRIMSASGLDLSLGDYTLLAHISAHAPVRLSALAELMEVDKSTLTPPAKRLESRGFVAREPDPADARAQLLRVTRSGKLAIGKLWRARTATVSDLVSDWAPGDVERLATALAAFADAIRSRG